MLKKIKETQLLSEEQFIAKKQSEAKGTADVHPSPKPKYHIRLKKHKKSSPLFYAAIFLFFLLFAPFLITLILAGIGTGGLYVAKQSLLSGNLAGAYKSASFSQVFFGVSQTTGNVVAMQARLLGMGAQGDKLKTMLSLGEEGSYALSNVISAGQTYLAIFHKTTPTPKEDFINASNKLKKAVTVFQKIQAQDSLPGIADVSGMVSLLGATIDSYPTLFGMEEPKTYLLLFQNNAELRPGGGFIGSYGLVTLNKGSIADFQIHDVYDADGQLTGHVEPAYPFRRHLKLVHQYLRDSNYSPDFPTAASSSANMFALETGKGVAGVIGVDVSFVKALVAALGEVYVPDYKETVTADNFYIITQSHAEKNFFPGSTQKKDFLRSLFTAMQLKLTEEKSLPYLSLGKAVAQAIEEKHILFAFPDPSIQHLFSVNNLSSSLLDTRETKQNQYNDFFGISETNIGVNKANAYVFRKIDQRVTIDEVGKIKNTVTIRYKNDSTKWPGGDYLNYLRILTPKGSLLTDITIDGKKQTVTPAITDYLLYERPDFTAPSGLEVETVEEKEKTLFGFLVKNPQGAFTTISVSYSSPVSLKMNQQVASYNLWYFKQPGTDAYAYSFVLTYPETFTAYRSTKGMSVVGNSVVFEKTIPTDEHFHIELSKK